MKCYLSFILAGCALTLAQVAIAGPAEDMLAKAELTEAGLVAMADAAKNTPAEDAKKKPTLDPVAYEALLLAHKGVPGDPKSYYRLDWKAPAVKALSAVQRKYNLPSHEGFIDRLLANPDPSVRAKAVTLMRKFLLGTSSSSKNKAVELLKTETEPMVLAAIVSTFANDGGKVPEIGQFLVKCLDNSDPVIRKAVATYSTSSWNFKTPGLSEKLAGLILTEKDANVRKEFLEKSGSLGKDVIYDSYAKVLDGDESAEVKSMALKGLLRMWWSFPLYNTYNEKAYRKTLAYIPTLKDEAANRKIFGAALDALGQKSSSEHTLKTYAQNAPWYVAADVRAILLPLAEFQNLDSFSRAKLFKGIYLHGGTAEEVKSLVEKALEATQSNFDKKQYEKVLTDLKLK